MEVKELSLPGCFLITPNYYEDVRGEFYEAFNKKRLEQEIGQPLNFVQDNLSVSKKGTLRGLHFQKGVHAQAKYLRVLQGAVLDVVVDLRKDSSEFGQHMKIRMSGTSREALFIPRGMAHGFLALEEDTRFLYKCDNYYQPTAEGGIHYRDPELCIDWEFPADKIILSPKDQKLSLFKDLHL